MEDRNGMPPFHFSHPIEVRYADLDPQRHVNNVAIFAYFEQARAKYLEHLGLWDGGDFDDLGIIVAEATATFRAPIAFTDQVLVDAGVTRLGNKSLDVEYTVHAPDGHVFATGRTVLVAYDYRRGASMPIPDAWRTRMAQFEGLDVERRSANERSEEG